MTEPTGRREQHKRVTRAALHEAAQRLFAERGYQQTTVRDIAEAAGVTERTFFRYFGAKEELVLASAGDWLGPVSAAIRARPDDEDAVTAVQRVVLATEALMRASDGPTLLSLYADRVPAEFVRADGPREMRMRLLVLETALAPAIRERLLRDGVPDDDLLTFRSEALARTCVALVRTALLHDLALRRSGAADRPTLNELLDATFTDLHRSWRP
ncbi:MAG TPA: TetR family transcriptional regulator [Candidatus Nanopelagicales bacterium]